MNKPYISVIMAVFNAETFLNCAIESILNQSVHDFEFIIVNDGSTDKSRDIILSYQDARIKLFDNSKNMGLVYSLNRGIAQSKGKYIARMDADDISFPQRFKQQVDYLESNPAVDLISSKAVVFFDSEHILGTLPFSATHKEICKQPWRGFSMPHPTWMGRSEWFQRFPYESPEVLRAEDQALLLDAYPTSCFASLDQILVGYRQNSFNFIKTFLARRSLLLFQLKVFFRRRQWLYFLLSSLMFILKVGVDLVAAIPVLKKAFFYRMSNNMQPHEIEEFRNLMFSFRKSN